MAQNTILIVDDDKGQLLRLSTLLGQAGYQVLVANNGNEALPLLRDTPCQMVISDVLMTGMDGYELAMRIRGDDALRHLLILLHSSIFTDNKDRLLAEAIGIDAYFDKSIAVEELLKRVNELFSAPRINDDSDHFDDAKFQRMRAQLLTGKVANKQQELEHARHQAHLTATRFETIANALPDLVAEITADYRYAYLNRAYEEWLGAPCEAMIGHHIEEVIGSENFAKTRPRIAEAFQGKSISFEDRFHTASKGARDLWVRYLPHLNNEGMVETIYAIASDITEQKHSANRLQKNNAYYQILLQLNRLITTAESEHELLAEACRIISDGGNYPLSWIGLVASDSTQRVVPIAQAGFEEGYLQGIEVSWGDNELGRGPTGKAIRTKKPQAALDIIHDLNFTPWREQALRYHYASSLALPIIIDTECIAVLNVYSRHPFAFEIDDIEMLEKLADDIGHGIHTLRLQQQQRQVEESLRKSNRAYRTLVRLKKCLSQQQEESSLLQQACQILIDGGAYRLAWIGLTDMSPGKPIHPVASAGDEADYLDALQLSWGNNAKGRGPIGSAVREQRAIIIEDVAASADFQLWSEAASERGYRSVIALPIKTPQMIVGVLTLYADVKHAFVGEEVALLEEFSEELASGIAALRQNQLHQRTESELAYQRKLFEAVFRHTPDTMVITDTEHRIILCNSALIRDFGYVPEELYGKSPAQLYADETEFTHQQQLRFNRQASDINTPYTLDYRRKNGEAFPGETLSAIFRDRDKNLLGYITIIRDVTERRGMEKERLQLEMQLQQAQKMETVGQLTGGIAHDFNNILASILGYTELALSRIGEGSDEQSARLRRYLNEIDAAGGRARDIIAKLLAFSRTHSSEQKPIELRPLIEETASLLRPILPSTIDLSLKFAEQMPLVEADASQLHQVIMNLCVNARDAMEGRGRIEMSVEPASSHRGRCSACGESFGGNYLCLTVRDNGSGIPAEVLSRIFDPFFTTKPLGKGSGLGLSMVLGIIHNHRGHLEVETSSKGTSFHIYLPIPGMSEPTAPAAAPTEKSNTVVVIDDEQFVMEFIEQLLRFSGYKTRGFTDPLLALDALLKERIACDLVITDQVMPGMNGMELASLLKQQRPEVPVLLTSAYLSGLSNEEVEKYGINDFIPKPVKIKQLLPLVQGLLK